MSTMAMSAQMQMPNVFDNKGMTEMQARARKDPEGSLKMVAKQFEAYFIGLMLKQARESMMGSMLDSSQTKMFASLADQQMSLNMANNGGFGFADMLVKQLEQRDSRFGAKKEIQTNLDPADEKNGTIADDRQKLSARTIRLNREMPTGLKSDPLYHGLRSLSDTSSATSDQEKEDEYSATLGIIVRFQEAQAQKQRAASQALQSYQQQATTQAAGTYMPNTPADIADHFIASVLPHAREASKITGIPTKFLIAHAALETGWGRRQIKDAQGNNSHNLFGIKAGKSWNGSVANATTTEYIAGKAQKQVEPFRAYGSYRDAFLDYANLLKNNPRYSLVSQQDTPAKFAQSLQDAGYATDPEYAKKLESVILAQKLIGIN